MQYEYIIQSKQRYENGRVRKPIWKDLVNSIKNGKERVNEFVRKWQGIIIVKSHNESKLIKNEAIDTYKR